MTQDTRGKLDAQDDVYGYILTYAAESARAWHEAWCMGEGAWRMASRLCENFTTLPWLNFKEEMLRIGNKQKEHTYQLDATAQ